MELVLKILTFLLLGIGAFFVYGAKFVAERLNKQNNPEGDQVSKLTNPSDNEGFAKMEDEQDPNLQVNRKIINIKLFGTVFILAGGILALVVFK